MKTKKITSLLLITFQSTSLFGTIQFATSCANADEIIAHAETYRNAVEKIGEYLHETDKTSAKALNHLASKYLPKRSNFTVTEVLYSYPYCEICYNYFSDVVRSSSIIVNSYSRNSDINFTFFKRVDENNKLYSFSFFVRIYNGQS
jgi:hypothetical protein